MINLRHLKKEFKRKERATEMFMFQFYIPLAASDAGDGRSAPVRR
jgi:hypothetical protein